MYLIIGFKGPQWKCVNERLFAVRWSVLIIVQKNDGFNWKTPLSKPFLDLVNLIAVYSY